MKFELGLLENSYDYIINSFDLYMVADEFGQHDEQKSNIKNKVKWKLAFITLVQAVELLLKESISIIHPSLVYENIDSENVDGMKTVSVQQAINRINNFKNNIITSEEKAFILGCSKTRNEFIHYKVNIQSESIKSKYSVLYTIYKEIHNKLLGKVFTIHENHYQYIESEILEYHKNFTVYRGIEFNKDELIDYKKAIKENSSFKHYITRKGERVERIRYGDEVNRVSQELRDTWNYTNLAYFDICDDCLARKGEFHLEDCDIEICPVCFGQLISCDCIAEDEEDCLIKVI